MASALPPASIEDTDARNEECLHQAAVQRVETALKNRPLNNNHLLKRDASRADTSAQEIKALLSLIHSQTSSESATTRVGWGVRLWNSNTNSSFNGVNPKSSKHNQKFSRILALLPRETTMEGAVGVFDGGRRRRSYFWSPVVRCT
jgi:hypothetical protein